MTGDDLIVLAPWAIFGAGLAVVYLLLRRSRRSQPSPAARCRRRSGPGPGPGAGSPPAGPTAGCGQHRASS